MDGGAWWATVHGVAKSRKRLIDFTFTFFLQKITNFKNSIIIPIIADVKNEAKM